MATAKKLPSGSWRVRVYDKVKGKYISFTAGTKKEAELLGAEYLNGLIKDHTKEKTVADYIEDYIESKSNVLSPSTISGYRKIQRCWLVNLDIYPSELNQDNVQRYFNELALRVSAKSVKHAHGLFMSVLNVYFPDVRLKTSLPKVQKKIKHLPDVADVIEAVRDTDVELPCMLALWLGMRMSEIRGIRKQDIKGNVLTIQNTITCVDGKDVERESTKTYNSTRQIALPDYILHLISLLPPEQEYLVPHSRNVIYKHFKRILSDAQLEDMTFHDLRHLNASTMLALGIPDKYAMERGGWSSTNIMKSVYQHTITDERKRFDSVVDDYFNEFLKNTP